MIRKSLVLAFTAIAISLMAHVLGVGLTVRIHPPPPEPAPGQDVVTVSDSFEDLVEAPLEPVFPDPAQTPEPEETPETPPEPETTEASTSDVKVASSTPKQTFAPDAAVAPEIRPDLTEPVIPDPTEPDATSETAASPDVQVDLANAPTPQQGEPEGDPVAAVPQPVAPDPVTPVTPSSDQLAALPAPTPTPPIAPTVQADPAQTDAVPQVDAGTVGDVSSSLRPRLPPDRAALQPEGTPEGTGTASARAPLIESPLTAYQRSGVNVFGGQSSRSASGREGFSGSGGVGNADTTNYAGQVLVHLNRTPPVAVSGRGWARVFFEINPDGSLASVDVIDGSGSSEIDRAAKAQVRRGEPFPRPPNGQRRKLNFVYSIR